MQHVVSRESLDEVCFSLSRAARRGLDTETTGTEQEDRIFAITITESEDERYYFNFNPNAPDPSLILDRAETFARLEEVFGNPDSIWDLANAKFDLRMLRKEGIEVAGEIHCTEAIERILYNGYMQYGLAACASRRGLQKSEAVEEYIAANGLYEMQHIPGKNKRVKKKFFDRVPFEVMEPYASHDSYLATMIARDQEAKAIELTNAFPEDKSLLEVVRLERKLTKTLSRVEGEGIRLDQGRTKQALEYELSRAARGREAFREATGEEFVNSGKALGRIFDRFGVPYLKTDKGNPSFPADWLDELPDSVPLGKLINGIRRPEKRASTYYSTYLHLVTSAGRIHCDIRQGGTESGRLSAREPNLTNIPKEDEEEDLEIPYHVRECFLPDEGFFFLDMDWQAIQYRIMVDMAGEKGLFQAIMDGEDVHTATARLCGIARKQAKTLNFALLFGAGPAKVAAMLGISVREATALRNHYFARLPAIERFIKAVTHKVRSRGFVFNPYGRRCHLIHQHMAYAVPCHLIQGTEGDTLRRAMVQIDELLLARKARTRMVLPVHDEILFNMHPSELELVPEIKRIMETVYDDYAFNGMKLVASVEHATERWGSRNLKKGLPDGFQFAS